MMYSPTFQYHQREIKTIESVLDTIRLRDDFDSCSGCKALRHNKTCYLGFDNSETEHIISKDVSVIVIAPKEPCPKPLDELTLYTCEYALVYIKKWKHRINKG